MNPLHASCYADNAAQHQVAIIENVLIAEDTYRIRVEVPQMAARIVPGQFAMLRLADCDAPLIGRPLAVFDVIADAWGRLRFVDLVYLVKGKFTSALCKYQAGMRVDIWGPLGNGFPAEPVKRLILVVGGIGQTPMLAVGKEYLGHQAFGDPKRSTGNLADEVILCYGARRKELLAGLEAFEAAGMDVRIATDDGSAGHHGLVTDLLEEELSRSKESCRVFCCGPEVMMEAVAEMTRRFDVPCLVSLETPMACGIGICFTCVAKIKDDGGWDYKRTCVEGPVFEASQIVW